LTLYVSESVVVETVYVLCSRVTYNLPRSEVQHHLSNIFYLSGFRIPQKNTYRRALELWVTTPQVRDFVDCLSVAQMERLKLTTIASFDQDFDRFPQIKRLEPEQPRVANR
jgi:predicted nucleic acid-binding protein